MAEAFALPGPKEKGWEFTDLSGLDLEAYASGAATVEGLVATNGDASAPIVMPLAAAAEAYPELVREHLGTIVPAADAFTARNAEYWRDGVFVHVPAGMRLE